MHNCTNLTRAKLLWYSKWSVGEPIYFYLERFGEWQKQGSGMFVQSSCYQSAAAHLFSSALTDVHVSIFWRSYSDTSQDFTREIEEEKLEF